MKNIRGGAIGGVIGGAIGSSLSGFEGAVTGGAVIGAIFGGLDNNAFRGGLGGLAVDQFIEGRGDPCFEFDFTSIAIDGLSATGGALTGGAAGGLAQEISRVTSRNAARAAFRAGDQSAIRAAVNGLPPTGGQQIGQSIGASGIGTASEISARTDQASPGQYSSNACGEC